MRHPPHLQKMMVCGLPKSVASTIVSSSIEQQQPVAAPLSGRTPIRTASNVETHNFHRIQKKNTIVIQYVSST